MSYRSAQRIPLSDKKPLFSGGLIDNSQNIDMAPNYSPYLKNCRLDGASIIIRKGHSLFATLTAGDFPRGIGSYLRSTAADDRLVVRHNQAYTPAYLTGGTGAISVVATWNAVTDGAFQLSIDGTARSITGLDFSTDTTMALVATRIQTAIRALTSSTETVVRSTDHFIISSVNVTSSSAITVLTAGASGTDISGAGATAFMDGDTGHGTVTNKLTNKLVTITTAGAITAISTGTNIASDNNMQFVNVGDVIYCMNGSDNMGYLSGTTYTLVTSGFSTKTFNNSGLNDLKAYGCNTAHTFIVTIDAAAATDTFKWNIDGGGYTTGVAITGGYQPLSNGLTIKFTNTTGHTLNASWTITTVASAAPSFGVIFNSSMFISGVSANPNVVYKSVGDVYSDFTNIGSDTFTFGEPITGLAAVGEALFYFTKNTISVTNTSDITDTAGIITYTNRKLQVSEGAANHKCIVCVGNEVFYLTSSNTIKKIARGQSDGFDTLDLSNRPYNGINNLMLSLAQDQSTSFGYYEPDTKLIKRHLKTIGSSINDIAIVYDTTKDCFLKDTNIYFTDAIWFKGYNYSTSNTESKVFLNEYGQDDEDSPIPFEYRTKEFFVSDPTFKKILRESRTLADINELANLYQYIYIDGALADTKLITDANIPISSGGIAITTIGTQTIGTGGASSTDDLYEVDILRTKGNLNTKFKKVQRRFVENTVAGKVRLKNITAKVEVSDPITTKLTV